MAGTRVFDLHCDTLDRLAWPMLSSELQGGDPTYEPNDCSWVVPGQLQAISGSPTHISLERTEGIGWCQCMGVFIPDKLSPEQALRFFDAVSGTLAQHVEANPDRIAQVRSVGEAERAMVRGKLAAMLTVENARLLAVGEGIAQHMAEAGVRVASLTWNGAGPLGSGNSSGAGLSERGRRAIAELEDAGIVVDVSHLNDRGFAELLQLARRPFIATHSNSRVVRNVPRNLADDQFRAIRDAGGIVGLNFCRDFVSGSPDPSPDELLAHVDHWLDLDGASVIALGSDYDGCDVPSWLDPASKMRDLDALLRERYGDWMAERIMFENAASFFRRYEADLSR